MKSIQRKSLISLIFVVCFCFSSCSWSTFLLVGNKLDQDIKITYRVNQAEFLKSPKTYSFDKKRFNFKRKFKKNSILELPNNSHYNDTLNTVTLTIKPGEISLIGGYMSFESFEQKLTKSELKIMIEKDSILEKEKLIEFSKYRRKCRVLEIK